MRKLGHKMFAKGSIRRSLHASKKFVRYALCAFVPSFFTHRNWYYWWLQTYFNMHFWRCYQQNSICINKWIKESFTSFSFSSIYILDLSPKFFLSASKENWFRFLSDGNWKWTSSRLSAWIVLHILRFPVSVSNQMTPTSSYHRHTH